MGISGRIRPNPTRSIRTVKNIMAMDAFFIGSPAGAKGVNKVKSRTDSRLETIAARETYRQPGLSAMLNSPAALFLDDFHVLAQGALQAGAGHAVIVQGLRLGGARLGQGGLRVQHVQLGGAAGGQA